MSEYIKVLNQMIGYLDRAQKTIWAVMDVLMEKNIDNILRYCEDYTSITIKDLKELIKKAEFESRNGILTERTKKLLREAKY